MFRASVLNEILRIIINESDATVDHRCEWSNLDFKLTRIRNKVYLVGDSGIDWYEKL